MISIFLLNDVPQERGLFAVASTTTGDVFEIYNVYTRVSLSKTSYTNYSPDGITGYSSLQTLLNDLKVFFFPLVGGGSGGTGVQSVLGDGVGGTATDPVLSFPNADDVSDTTTTNKFVTDAQKAKLNRIGNVNRVNDYKVGNYYRMPYTTSENPNFQVGDTQPAQATQVWLMGDGTSDSYANGIRNYVQTSEQNWTKLQLNSMVSNDFQTVNIPGLT